MKKEKYLSNGIVFPIIVWTHEQSEGLCYQEIPAKKARINENSWKSVYLQEQIPIAGGISVSKNVYPENLPLNVSILS